MRTSCRKQRGITLVEVLAGSALMGTVLVSIVLAQSGLSRQTALARRRSEACEIADSLLRRWWSDRSQLPRNSSGEIEDRPGWSWRTETVACEQFEDIGAEIVTLEVFFATAESAEAAVRVQILLPKGTDAIPEGTDTD